MVSRRYSHHLFTLALLVSFPFSNGFLTAKPLRAAEVIVSDEIAEMNAPSWEMDDEVRPAQFQARSRARASSRTSTQLAAGSGRSTQFGQVRLANAPKMMGDFFSLPGQTAVIGELFTGQGTPFTHEGLAVHQTMGSFQPTTNKIAIITTDSGTSKTVYLGGPALLTNFTFFEPSIDPNDIENPQTGLQLAGDPVNTYTAVLTGDTTDVFDNPTDSSAAIPDAPVYRIFQVTEIEGSIGPNPGDLVGRVRIQDNNNAMPQDRIIFDYNFFHNVPFTANGINVNRFTPGLEKTFLDGMGSVEVRVPMAITFNSNQFQALGPDTSNPEFGNLTIIPKILLTSNDECALAAGMGISLPTADDINIYGQAGTQILSVENESVHLVPFVGYLLTPRYTNCFFLSFVTVDVDTNGNDVRADVGSGSLEQIGVWNDQTLISASGTFGHYLFQDYSRNSIIKSVSLLGELHYTSTVSDADTINSGAFLLGDADRQIDVLNATFGGHVRLKNSTVTTGYSVPLTSSDRVFDGELRVFINRFF